MSNTRQRPKTRTHTLRGRRYQPARVDFLTHPASQRVEDHLRGRHGGRAEGEGFAFETPAGEQPAHTVIDAQRDRGLAEAGEAFEQPRTNAVKARDEAVKVRQAAERERNRLLQLQAAKQAELTELEARHAA